MRMPSWSSSGARSAPSIRCPRASRPRDARRSPACSSCEIYRRREVCPTSVRLSAERFLTHSEAVHSLTEGVGVTIRAGVPRPPGKLEQEAGVTTLDEVRLPGFSGTGREELEQLVRDAAAGSQHAWKTLVARFERLVWAVARAHRLNSADAADVVQTTWLRLVEHLGDVQEPERLGAWLATTARRECLRTL